MNTAHLAAAQAAYLVALAEMPCPLGVGNNDQYAMIEAANAAEDAGATSQEAWAIGQHLDECGGHSRLLTAESNT